MENETHYLLISLTSCTNTNNVGNPYNQGGGHEDAELATSVDIRKEGRAYDVIGKVRYRDAPLQEKFTYGKASDAL